MTIALEQPGRSSRLPMPPAWERAAAWGTVTRMAGKAEQRLPPGLQCDAYVQCDKAAGRPRRGILGTTPSTDDLFAVKICDGIHVDPAIVKLFWRAKGAERSVPATGAMSATGMPDGECMSGGGLAGSVLSRGCALRTPAAFSGVLLPAVFRQRPENRHAWLGWTIGLAHWVWDAARILRSCRQQGKSWRR